ncbi:aspartate-semialdehyde dehydrogenase [Hydrogenobacter thermophilus TK-6]|uniref:Aspartate-semialdehyde dehydrogenase n=1 Tax=Hydrogenobacter thermophilus (strain DSM 6534 / IAM 12695 / TK-6) TaxID=608538 RepID=D3DGU9_HYDTT|nr:aspartate-semialdehyde dehydrogenase [Hydrogenobacter thermophilus]ADO44987.1 aspartate-semialdehyde dehydrogenase [Hydrogenobacter thermophilus TK-6]BAI69051.1 aspartate-semialdehyde dehydrogenase [Hydrogenobacter thermophilus TK-6]
MGYRVAIVGATGEVGRAFLKVLEERDFPVDDIQLFASERSEGTFLTFRGQKVKVQALNKRGDFKGIDIALFSAGSSVSKEYAPKFASDGAVVIDNSSAWRLDPQVPLVVPEVNPEDVKEHKGIIANPNCSTIQMVVALKPIYDAVGIEAIIVSTYQSVSGAGAKAIRELERQTRAWCKGDKIPDPEALPKRIAFNVIPQIDVFTENGYTKEEMKMLNETRKIMHDPNIKVSATTVRVPVFYGHSEAVSVKLKKEISPEEVKKILSKAKGVIVFDETSSYPTALDVAGRDEVFVGRIRRDLVFDPGISMWIVADNIRKGAATNAVQIAELLTQFAMV